MEGGREGGRGGEGMMEIEKGREGESENGWREGGREVGRGSDGE